MGCDIHLYKEKKVNGVWVTADEFVKEYSDEPANVPWEKRYTYRDYDLFGFLCEGVRRNNPYAFKPRGIPFNVSLEVNTIYKVWGPDSHGSSYLNLSELKEAWLMLQDTTVKVSGMKDREGLRKLQESIDSDDDTNWDLIYPFCQESSDTVNNVDFKFDVPASFKLSELETIISLFNDVDGDDHRIVFWFDN
jgi:hypothetical protein